MSGRNKLLSIFFLILSLLLFLTAHYLASLVHNGITLIFFGFRLHGLIIDVILWSGIILQIISILLVVKSGDIYS